MYLVIIWLQKHGRQPLQLLPLGAYSGKKVRYEVIQIL